MTLAVLAGACAPAPTPMSATEASEILARFAAGAAPLDLCTPEGRAVLRGAVRAYGAAMQSGGVAWPAARDGEPTAITSVEAAVLVAQWAGFVEADDLRNRADAPSPAIAALPELRALRGAALSACEEAARLQRAAAQVALEAERYRWLSAAPEAVDAADIERQVRRLVRAQAQLQMAAADLGG